MATLPANRYPLVDRYRIPRNKSSGRKGRFVHIQKFRFVVLTPAGGRSEHLVDFGPNPSWRDIWGAVREHIGGESMVRYSAWVDGAERDMFAQPPPGIPDPATRNQLATQILINAANPRPEQVRAEGRPAIHGAACVFETVIWHPEAQPE